MGLLSACKEEAEEEVTPSEDLMREHGVLNRILLIYDACRTHLISKEQFDLSVLNNSAQIIRTFIEDYHEKLGEDFEKKEHELFGIEGFESIVEKVADIEKQLGIYDLSEFTPII